MKNQKDIKLFPPAGPLELFAMDLLGPLLKTVHETQHVPVLTDRVTKLTRSILLRTTSASVFLNLCLDKLESLLRRAAFGPYGQWSANRSEVLGRCMRPAVSAAPSYYQLLPPD